MPDHPARPGRAAPTTAQADAVAEIARHSEAALLPAMRQADPDPLTSAAWQMSIGYERIADLLRGVSDPVRLGEVADDLAGRLRSALHDVHTWWASQQTPAELASQTQAFELAGLDESQALIEHATIVLAVPTGLAITVRLGEDHGGLTTTTSDSALFDPTVTGVDHLDLHAALDTIAHTLSARIADDAYGTSPCPPGDDADA